MNVNEAAERMRVNRRTIMTWIADGDLEVRKVWNPISRGLAIEVDLWQLISAENRRIDRRLARSTIAR